MVTVRFKKDTQNSFFGNFLYAQILPKNHFLVKAKDTIPWNQFTRKLLPYYKGGGEFGRSAYEPTKLLRMLLLSYLYNISERDTEEFVALNLAGKYFVGLGADESAPDHTSLTTFKERIIGAVGIKGYEALFNELLRVAMGKGIVFGQIHTVDSVHTIANVNIPKDAFRREKKGKGPRDPDASWGVKKVRKVKQDDGTTKEVKDSFYGYKTHVSADTDSGLATALTVTSGEVADGEEFQPLVNKDRKLGIATGGTVRNKNGISALESGTAYTADKAYDDGDNHTFLEARGLQSAIILKVTRTASKQTENNAYWQAFKEREIYQKATALRYRAEQPFGIVKRCHGFARARYLGKTRMAIQSYLTFMAFNLKTIIKATTGVGFRGNLAYASAPIPAG